MKSALVLWLLSVAPPAPLPDVPAPLGRLDGVLAEKDTVAGRNELLVQAQLKGCDHPVPLHVTRFVSGVMFALQQLIEWLGKTPDLETQMYQRKGVLAEVLAGLGRATPGDVKGEVATLNDGKRPVARVRWDASAKECLPRITGEFFDSRSAVRLRYDADFGGEVRVTLVGDRCQKIAFVFDSKTQVFHPERRSCKGP